MIHYLKICLYLLFVWCITGCSPQVSAPVVEQPQTPKAPTVQVEPDSPCVTLGKLPPGQRDQIETAYVLYRDEIRFKRYDQALNYWRQAFYTAPAGNGRIKYQYDDGIFLYKDLFDKATDDQLKKSYVDTIFQIYDKRAECYGDKPYVLGRKGFDSYFVFGDYISQDQAFDYLSQSLAADGDTVEYFVINPLTKLLYDRVVDGKIPLDKGRKMALTLSDAVKKGLANCKNNCESWEIINEYAPNRLETLEGVKGFYTCDYYIQKYYNTFDQSSTDCEEITRVLRILNYGDCDKNLEAVQKISQLRSANCKQVVTEAGPLRQAFDSYNEGKYQEAVQKFDAFVQNTTDVDKKAKYSLLIAKIYYRDIKNYPNARQYALKAASFKSNWGEPYMLIGKLYASSGPICGPGRGWKSQIVTWPAIDKWQYAKSIDSSVSAEANQLISQYRKYMPKKEDIFSRSIAAGSSFTVGCWINEKTTVRTAD